MNPLIFAIGNQFNLVPANNTAVIAMQYSSCSSFIVDQAGVPLTYCRTDWVRNEIPTESKLIL